MEVTVAAIGDQRWLWKTDVLNNHRPSNQRSDRTPLVLTYDPLNERIKRNLLRKFNILTGDTETREVFPQSLLVAYRHVLESTFEAKTRTCLVSLYIAEHFNTAGHCPRNYALRGKRATRAAPGDAPYFSAWHQSSAALKLRFPFPLGRACATKFFWVFTFSFMDTKLVTFPTYL